MYQMAPNLHLPFHTVLVPFHKTLVPWLSGNIVVHTGSRSSCQDRMQLKCWFQSYKNYIKGTIVIQRFHRKLQLGLIKDVSVYYYVYIIMYDNINHLYPNWWITKLVSLNLFFHSCICTQFFYTYGNCFHTNVELGLR